jgi:hypothetical protein
MLPADQRKVVEMARDALAAGDMHTVNNVLAMPTVHAGRPSNAEIEKLRQARLEAERPDIARAVSLAEENVAVVEDAHRAAEQYLDEMARGLPKPDSESGLSVAPDGLHEMSPSAFKDATGV